MSDALSPADVQNLMLLSALKTDDAMAERIKRLLAAHQAVEDTLAQVREERAAAQAEREEGRQALAHARLLAEESVARAERLAVSEQGLRESLTTHNADKKALNEMRAQIEADLKARTAALEAAEADLAERLAHVHAREAVVSDNLATSAALRASLERKHRQLRAALDEQDPPAPPEQDVVE